MSNESINFKQKKIPTWQLAILGFIFIGGGLVAPLAQMLQGSEHAEKWNAYVAEVQPLLMQQDAMLNRMVIENDRAKLPIFLKEAETLSKQIKAIDGENEELDHIHDTMEKRAELLVQALEQLNNAEDPNASEVQQKIQPMLIEAKQMIDEFNSRRNQYARDHNFQIIDS